MNKSGLARKGGSKSALPTRIQGVKAGVGSFVFKGSLEVSSELEGFKARPEAWKALLRHYLRALDLPSATLSLSFCGDARSKTLNRQWRKKNRPTDVLSFPLNSGRVKKGFKGGLGDLVINVSYSRRHAGRFADEFGAELAFLALHGLLHLTGRHHDSPAEEASMWRLSRKVFPPPDRLLRGLAPE